MFVCSMPILLNQHKNTKLFLTVHYLGMATSTAGTVLTRLAQDFCA
jgi:hypothetical protein